MTETVKTTDQSEQDDLGGMTAAHGGRGLRRSAALAAVGLVMAGAALAGCGEPAATPMDDEYAGNSGETQQSQEEASKQSDRADGGADGSADGSADGADGSDDSDGSDGEQQDTGNYADGTYSINGQYGPVGEDTIDVHVTVKDQNVESVEIVGHPFTSISKSHQDAFAQAINGEVDGKPLKDLSVDKVAGASWTSEAFNEALKVCREQASIGK